jgi:hypothetical protein
MDYKNWLIALGFSPKENAVGVFVKKYQQVDDYCLEIACSQKDTNPKILFQKRLGEQGTAFQLQKKKY